MVLFPDAVPKPTAGIGMRSALARYSLDKQTIVCPFICKRNVPLSSVKNACRQEGADREVLGAAGGFDMPREDTCRDVPQRDGEK